VGLAISLLVGASSHSLMVGAILPWPCRRPQLQAEGDLALEPQTIGGMEALPREVTHDDRGIDREDQDDEDDGDDPRPPMNALCVRPRSNPDGPHSANAIFSGLAAFVGLPGDPGTNQLALLGWHRNPPIGGAFNMPVESPVVA
jgi:hypothetical protein